MLKRLLLKVYKQAAKILSGHGFGNFYPVKVINGFIVSRLQSTKAEVFGHMMYLGPRDTMNLSIEGIHEPEVTELVNREINKGDIVLDIGANIGYYTLIFARLVGENGRVFAFEPDPTNFGVLKKNVAANGYNNVVLLQKAVSNETGRTMLYLSQKSATTHTISQTGDDRQAIEIEVTRLDDYFKDSQGKINFIKMDIQGAEYGAIKSMRNLLMQNNDVKIAMEFHIVGLQRFGVEPKECLDLLTELGFTIYQISDGESRIQPVDINGFPERLDAAQKKRVNLFCRRD